MDAILQARAEQLATEFANQHHTAEDLNGLMRRMMKTELDVHLGRKARPAARPPASGEAAPTSVEPPAAATRPSKPNRRNGHSRKTVQGDLGELTLSTPRDRDGTFEPLLIPKHQRRVPG